MTLREIDVAADTHPLKLAFAREYPGELAIYLATQGGGAIAEALRELPAEPAAAVVARLPDAHAMRVLAGRDDESIAEWLNAANLDDALSLMLHVEESRQSTLLASLSNRRMRRVLQRLVIYPRETVGALVNPSALRLNAETQLAEAIAILRADQLEAEQSIWLVGDDGGYLGLFDLRRAIVARSDTLKLDEFIIPVRPLRAETTLANARDFGEWLEHAELPVTDDLGHLLGSVSRTRLMTALDAVSVSGHDLMDGMSEFTRQYFRVMGICLREVFGMRGRER